jgi:hypothetical protein
MPDQTKPTPPPAEVRDHRALPGRDAPSAPLEGGVTGKPGTFGPGRVEFVDQPQIAHIEPLLPMPPGRAQPGQEERRCSD